MRLANLDWHLSLMEGITKILVLKGMIKLIW